VLRLEQTLDPAKSDQASYQKSKISGRKRGAQNDFDTTDSDTTDSDAADSGAADFDATDSGRAKRARKDLESEVSDDGADHGSVPPFMLQASGEFTAPHYSGFHESFEWGSGLYTPQSYIWNLADWYK